jgi:hypothetical protein
MLWLAFVSSLLGFAALALSMSRHHQQVCRREPSRRRQGLLRLVGWGLLLAALALCQAHAGWASGLVWWTGLLTAAALLVIVLLTYRPSGFARSVR